MGQLSTFTTWYQAARLHACFLLVFVVPGLVNDCRAQDHTLTFDSGDDIYKISFPPNKISEAKLREYAVLSPYFVSYFNNMP